MFVGTRRALLSIVTQVEAEQLAISVLVERSFNIVRWYEMMDTFPTPWSPEFGYTLLDYLAHVIDDSNAETAEIRYWIWCLPNAARALPSACFIQAQMIEPSSALSNDTRQQWDRAIKAFTDTIRIRQRLIEEIAL
jgi:hypothetical protein